MDQPTAETVVLGGGAVAALVWLLGVRAYARLSADPAKQRTRVPVKSASAAAMAELVRWGTQDGRRIVQQSADRIVVEQGPICIHLVLLHDTAGPVLEIGTDMSAWRGRFLLGVGLVVFGIAPLLLAGLTAGLYYLVAPSPHPGVRWQVFQIVQCVHVLWPPFLFVSVYSRTRRQMTEGLPANLRALIEVAVP